MKSKELIIPVLIYVVFVVVYVGFAQIKKDKYDYLFLPVWDIEHYLTISETGYEVYPCTPGQEYPFGRICGNVGWYPMWPIVAAAIRPLAGGSPQLSFMIPAFLFSLIALILLYRFLRRHYTRTAAVIGTAAVAFSPPAFYLLTGFPYSLFFLLFMGYISLLYGGIEIWREIVIFLLALMISLTYPTGLLVLLIPVVKAFRNENPGGFSIPGRGKILKASWHALPFILGPLILWTYFYFKFDDFFLQLHFQEKYARTWAFPLWVMARNLVSEPLLSPENSVLIWYGLIFLIFIPYRLKTELWVTGLIFYLFSPATGSVMSLYRHYLLIFPACMIIGTSGRPVWLKTAYIILGLAVSLGVLLPRFMELKLI